MSYDITITDQQGESVFLEHPHFIKGGTYAEDETYELWFNITYNYAPFYYRAETLGASTAESEIIESGGMYSLEDLTIPEARERVLRAIQNL